MQNYKLSEIVISIVFFLLILFFWNSIFIYPIKMFTVLLHEISHGVATVATGGHLRGINISSNLGGTAYTSGGLAFFILPAGYLGSMLCGGIILILATRTGMSKLLSVIIGIAIVVVTVTFISFFRNRFGFIFGMSFGGALFLIGIFAPSFFNEILLRIIGMTSTLYAIIDIKEDLITRTVPGSDAYQMARITHIPPIIWGILWIAIALFVTFNVIKIAVRK